MKNYYDLPLIQKRSGEDGSNARIKLVRRG
jgi:hypothetical protein